MGTCGIQIKARNSTGGLEKQLGCASQQSYTLQLFVFCLFAYFFSFFYENLDLSFLSDRWTGGKISISALRLS